jgi:hypothetical protein
MNPTPDMYGLFGFTHGWAKLLTVMSPQGVAATVDAIGDNPGVVVRVTEGILPQLLEQHEGALDRLIKKHHIVVLNRTEWDEQKAILGETIFL